VRTNPMDKNMLLAKLAAAGLGVREVKWSRLSEQIFRIDK
jgi:hypothetical protein